MAATVPTWLSLLAAALAVAGERGAAALPTRLLHQADAGRECPGRIGVLQWNVHGECFVQCRGGRDRHCDPAYPVCRGNATAFLLGLLEGSQGDLDFAGTEQLNDDEFLTSGLPQDGDWGHVTHPCGGTDGFGVYPFDSATIFYRRTRWEAVGGPHYEGLPQGGCMERVRGSKEANYRAFVLQAFERRCDGMRVLVVATHNPHFVRYHREISRLADAVQAIQERTGIKRLILAADSNWEDPRLKFVGRTSQTIMEDIYPHAGATVSTDLHLTCCAFNYIHTYDRVILGGFPEAALAINTTLPFGSKAPPWVVLNMHNPIIGKVTFSAGEA